MTKKETITIQDLFRILNLLDNLGMKYMPKANYTYFRFDNIKERC